MLRFRDRGYFLRSGTYRVCIHCIWPPHSLPNIGDIIFPDPYTDKGARQAVIDALKRRNRYGDLERWVYEEYPQTPEAIAERIQAMRIGEPYM
jgi:hypothetical protein